MNFSLLDWSIMAVLLLVVGTVAVRTRSYTRGVSDYLSVNRCAGRYLLTLSEGIVLLGLVGIIANFEKFYNAGFAASWWGNNMIIPISLLIALSGWVRFRYRQTRALTMSQFFEMRYSRRFRIFSGIVCWVSGVLNYGIFPGVVARFFVYFCGLPRELEIAGLTIPTIAPVMACTLGLTLLLITSGGMVTVMITDFIQSQFILITYFVLAVTLFMTFSWSTIVDTLAAAPAGKSLLNPFDQAEVSDFNIWFFVIFAFRIIYNCLGWQGYQGLYGAAKTPHESRMAGILAEWRGGVTYLMIALMPICAYVLLHNSGFSIEAGEVTRALQGIEEPQLQKQMTVPLALAEMLPVGVLGLFGAAMLAGAVGNDTTYLHAWGAIFVQDVLMPIRNRPFTPEQHLRLLRLSTTGVAIFAFFFSLYFPLRDYVLMYQLLTGAIYLAGSGAVIIGGLYWKKGTTAGAWSAMILGGTLAVGGLSLRTAWPSIPALVEIMPQFPFNGAQMFFFACVAAIITYVSVSLLTGREDFNLDKLLHRGDYAIEQDKGKTGEVSRWRARLGITADFTRGDRLIYLLKIGWTSFWFGAFIIGTTWALLFGIPTTAWANWWAFTVGVGMVVGLITVVWFFWGGVRDLRDLLHTLKTKVRDADDNGMVRSDSRDLRNLLPLLKAQVRDADDRGMVRSDSRD